ncbi:toxin RelE [Campylobacterota bacterium]|nr:toxin RelE [Campylobacterota bacterium]
METREFVLTAEFDRAWAKLGLDDDDLARFQDMLQDDPLIGDVVQGTGGLRKVRFAFGGRGKSGGARVVYVDFAAFETIYLMGAYAKSAKTDLTHEERKILAGVIGQIKDGLRSRK